MADEPPPRTTLSERPYIDETADAEPALWTTDTDGNGINLLDFLIVAAKHKKLAVGLPVVAGILAVIYALILPEIYTSTTKILPPQYQSASSGILAQLGAFGGLAGGVTTLKNPNDVYIAMLKSRTVADNLIQRFDLMKASKAKYPSEVREALARVTNITLGKDGVITIDVDDKDPKRAAELANAYVDELYKLTNVLAVTEASQRRLFFERQFVQAKDSLARAEGAARQALQKGGLVQVEGQSRAMIENTARLRGQITVKEVQIGAMRTFATAQNPELVVAQKELEAMKQELARLEGTGSATVLEDSKIDSRGMDSVRLLRNVKYYETIYELLAKQYELAKLDESKDSGTLQVLDKAMEPDMRSKPKRTQLVLLWTFVALGAGILLAFMNEAMARARSDPQHAARLQAIKHYLTWR